MKQLILFGLGCALLFLPFSGCNEDGSGGYGNGNFLSENYFTIEDATYSSQSLPSGDEALIEDVSFSNTVINGGSSILSFYSEEELKNIFISVKGENGYYTYNVAQAQQQRSASLRGATGFYYEIVLILSQSLSVDQFVLIISCETITGVISKVEESEPVSVVEVGTGKLQVSLNWDQYDDVDLHLLDPAGNHVFYANPWSASDEAIFLFYCSLVDKYTQHSTAGLNYENENDWDLIDSYLDDLDLPEDFDYIQALNEFANETSASVWGYLDLDSNAACYLDKINNENIFYSNPIEGTYKVYVDLYAKCDYSRAGAKYSVNVYYNGQIVNISDEQSGQFNSSYQGSGDDTDQYVFIGEFTLGSEGLRSSASGNNIQKETLIKKISSVLKAKK
jgi:hypothetical protein